MAKNVLVSIPIVVGQSMATSFVTNPTVISFLDNVGYQINIATSDSTGTFQVQCSSDFKPDEVSNTVQNAGNWVTLTLSSTPVAAAANDNISISLNQLPFTAVRVAYTAGTSGTGTCSIYMTAKRMGA